MHPTVQDWLKMSREELDQIYEESTPGPIPTGETRGTAIIAGSRLARAFSAFAGSASEPAGEGALRRLV